MDISALKKDAPLTAWVPMGDGIEVQIRHITREELLAIRKQATRITFDRSHQKQEEYDPIKGDVLLGQAVVVGWTGILDGKQEFPCTPENIELLMKKWAAFARLVNDTCADLEALLALGREILEKNW